MSKLPLFAVPGGTAEARAQLAPAQWQGAIAVHSSDRQIGNIVSSLRALCDHFPHLRIGINFFDASPLEPSYLHKLLGEGPGAASLEATQLQGMKCLFWKRYLTPERVGGMRMIWLFDSDIAAHPSVVPLAQVVGALLGTNATLIQPSVRALVHGTHHVFLRTRPAHMSCLATTAKDRCTQCGLSRVMGIG